MRPVASACSFGLYVEDYDALWESIWRDFEKQLKRAGAEDYETSMRVTVTHRKKP